MSELDRQRTIYHVTTTKKAIEIAQTRTIIPNLEGRIIAHMDLGFAKAQALKNEGSSYHRINWHTQRPGIYHGHVVLGLKIENPNNFGFTKEGYILSATQRLSIQAPQISISGVYLSQLSELHKTDLEDAFKDYNVPIPKF